MKFFPIAFFCLLLFSFNNFAQINANKPLKECSAVMARQIVEQQAEESKSVAETDKRIKILLRIADFLWQNNEETARKYFAEAFQFAQERFREKGFEDKKEKEITVRQPDYRFNVIAAIAKRDAEWAKKLSETVLKEFDEDKNKDSRNKNDENREVGELLGIAAQTAKSNPNLSLTFARRAMRYPLFRDWYWTLYRMARENQPLADQVYGELLLNYPNAEAFNLLYLSAYPFGEPRIFGAEKYSLGTSVPDNFIPNQNLKRQFLTTFLRRVLKLTAENSSLSLQNIPEITSAVMALNDLESSVAAQFPDLKQLFSQAQAHANSIVDAESLQKTKNGEEANKKFSNAFEAQLEEAEKAESEGKLQDSQIFRLVYSAKTEAQYKTAESWIDKVSLDTTKTALFNFFYFKRSKLAVEEKRFDDARKFALKVPQIEHRAVLFFDIAEAKMKEPMTKAESLDTLLEVMQTAEKSPDSIEKAQVLLGLTFMYEKVDRFTALSALSEAIKTANKLENPDLFTNSVTQMVKGNNFTHFSSYSVPGFEVTETFDVLSKKDYTSTLTYATNFSDRYVRTLAVLATVKDCEKNVEKIVKPKK